MPEAHGLHEQQLSLAQQANRLHSGELCVPSCQASARASDSGGFAHDNRRCRMSIPRIIHQTWKSSCLPIEFRAYQAKWRSLHPDYEYRLWTDADNAAFVQRDFPELYSLYCAFDREIFRADMVRCLYLVRFGGVYVDLDVEPLRALDEFLQQSGDCVLGSEPEVHARKLWGRTRLACNAVMASAPEHAFWTHLLDEIRHRAEAGWHRDPVSTTGPIVLDTVYRRHGDALNVRLSEPDAFFPLPDLDNQRLELTRSEQLHYRRMIELEQYPVNSWGVHRWAHTWIPTQRSKRVWLGALELGRSARDVLRAHKTIDEVGRPERYGVKFPERAFEPRPKRAVAYRRTVELGFKRARRLSIVFLVLLHDRLDLALLLRARLERLMRPFARARALLVCDDSTDGTARVMSDWQDAQPQLVRNVAAPVLDPTLPVYARMARLRNALLTAAESERPHDLVAVMDGDLEGPVSLDGLMHSVSLLTTLRGPAGVAAFGVNNWGGVPGLLPFLGYSYYDPIAFREHDWHRVVSDAQVRRRLGAQRRGDAPLPVNSAFAGLTIYRSEQLHGLRYDEASDDCEHVSLHRAFAQRGASLVVNPSLLLLSGRQGHHATRR
jgi:hypothetical protein